MGTLGGKAFPFSSGLFVRNCVGHFPIGTFPKLRGVNRELGEKRSGFGYDHDRDLGRTMLGIWVSPNRDLGESRARFGTPRYSSGIANRVSRNSSGTESLAPYGGRRQTRGLRLPACPCWQSSPITSRRHAQTAPRDLNHEDPG